MQSVPGVQHAEHDCRNMSHTLQMSMTALRHTHSNAYMHYAALVWVHYHMSIKFRLAFQKI